MPVTELEETLDTLQKSVKDMTTAVRSVCGFVEDHLAEVGRGVKSTIRVVCCSKLHSD
jgi:hypothetical protein